jgi:hypothetical protein
MTMHTGRPALFASFERRVDDLQRMVRLARQVQAGAGDQLIAIHLELEGAALAALEALLRGELPASVVEVAAATTATVLGKDYAVEGFHDGGISLLAKHPDCAGTARVLALLGTGSPFDTGLWRWRAPLMGFGGEPHADALLDAIDVVGAGSRPAAARLFERARRHNELPSVVWLAEIAACTTGDDAELRRLRRVLDDLLDSDAFGGSGLDASIVPLGRKELDGARAAIVAAFAELAALPRGSMPTVDNPESQAEMDELLATTATRIGVQQTLDTLDALTAEFEAAQRLQEVALGPFQNLAVPGRIVAVMDVPNHYATLGFRELYGLEILRERLPEVAALARAARAEPN